MTTRYLSLNGFAARAGLSRVTLLTYRHQGCLSEPDAIIGSGGCGGTHGWRLEPIDY
ncbi:transcriptional regulator [Trueperella pyogenes]|uniref:transcriptional regulator n=1 Tax=Trueperella pyogenes TaxID=1661 RepID=UPI00117EAC6D|nr:transcriptional regulator [Trueperella pyogenes]